MTKPAIFSSLSLTGVFLLIFVPPIVLFGWINTYGVDLPFYDEWDFMGTYLRSINSGELGLSQLLAPHNDHRIFTTRVMFWLFLFPFGWNRWAFFYTNFLTSCFTFALVIIGLYQKKIDIGWVWIVAICSTLLFSACQFENWTWGFQIQWFHLVFFSLLTLLLLIKISSPVLRITFACISGVATSLTIAGGLFIWPAGLIVLSLFWYQRRVKIILPLLWVLVGAATWNFYQQGLPSHSLFGPALLDPKLASLTFLAIIGGPLSNFRGDTACVFGALGLVLFFTIFLSVLYSMFFKNEDRVDAYDRSILWLAWASFCLLASFAIALARFTNGGVQYVLDASRYTSITAPFWLAIVASLYCAAVDILESPIRKLKTPLLVMSGVGACFFFFSTENSLKLWNHRRSVMSQARSMVQSYDPELLAVFSDAKAATGNIGFVNAETIKLLKAERLTPFEKLRNIITVPLPTQISSDGFIDGMAPVVGLDSNTYLRISGWAVDPVFKTSEPDFVLLARQDEIIAEIPCLLLREDVAKEKNLAPTVTSGWAYTSKRKDISWDNLQAYAVSKDRKTISKLAVLLPANRAQ